MEADAIVRVAVVAVAALAVVGIARFRPARRPAPLRIAGNLEGPGVFLFTSEDCDSCSVARQVYVDVLGADGFTELSWEGEPALLTRLGVQEIPVGSVVNAEGEEVASFRLIPDRRRLARAARSVGGR